MKENTNNDLKPVLFVVTSNGVKGKYRHTYRLFSQ